MKTRMIQTAGILLLSMLMVTAVDAQRYNNGGRGQGPCGAGDGPAYGMRYNNNAAGQYGRMDRMAGLDLTEEQQTEITTLRTEHFKTITPMRNKMTELKARERTLLSEADIDLKAVNKTIDEQSELANSMKKLQVEHRTTVKGLLTDEQTMKLDQRRMYARRDAYAGKGGRRTAGNGRGYRGW